MPSAACASITSRDDFVGPAIPLIPGVIGKQEANAGEL
jgi:hypothetical protein